MLYNVLYWAVLFRHTGDIEDTQIKGHYKDICFFFSSVIQPSDPQSKFEEMPIPLA